MPRFKENDLPKTKLSASSLNKALLIFKYTLFITIVTTPQPHSGWFRLGFGLPLFCSYLLLRLQIDFQGISIVCSY